VSLKIMAQAMNGGGKSTDTEELIAYWKRRRVRHPQGAQGLFRSGITN